MAPKRYSVYYCGFTLLELLLVIAIIGILLAISFTYLRHVKDQGVDKKIVSALVATRSDAEIFYSNHTRSFEGVCSMANTDSIYRFMQIAGDLYDASPGAYSDATASTFDSEQCHDSISAYVAWVPLRVPSNGSSVAWCVDSTGSSKVVTAILAPNTYVCPP